MASTFIMSNVIPQVHSLNAGLWEDLESAIAGRDHHGEEVRDIIVRLQLELTHEQRKFAELADKYKAFVPHLREQDVGIPKGLGSVPR